MVTETPKLESKPSDMFLEQQVKALHTSVQKHLDRATLAAKHLDMEKLRRELTRTGVVARKLNRLLLVMVAGKGEA